MTVKLSATSSRGIFAQRFGAELTKAMRTRKVSNLRLAEATGATRSAIANWKVAGNLPRTDTALRLAEALDWPKLVEIAREGRSRPCERCGRSVVNEGGGQKRYCTTACRDVDQQLRRPTAGSALADVVEAELERISRTTGAASRKTLKSALAAYRTSDAKRVARVDKLTAHLAGVQAAVDAMCAGCEPLGLCRDTACALRAVSPLPLASEVDAGVIRQPDGAWSPRFREQTLVRIADGNARRWARDGERERQSEQSRAWHAARTPDEKTDFRNRVSAGRRRQSEEQSA